MTKTCIYILKNTQKNHLRPDLGRKPQKCRQNQHLQSQKYTKNHPRPDLVRNPQKREQNMHLQS